MYLSVLGIIMGIDSSLLTLHISRHHERNNAPRRLALFVHLFPRMVHSFLYDVVYSGAGGRRYFLTILISGLYYMMKIFYAQRFKYIHLIDRWNIKWVIHFWKITFGSVLNLQNDSKVSFAMLNTDTGQFSTFKTDHRVVFQRGNFLCHIGNIWPVCLS